MINLMPDLIKDATDADVTFMTVAPNANGTFASNNKEVNIAWILGHVIVHTTASAEESAFLTAEMVCGVENHSRSRYETPWEEVTTIAQSRQRLEEGAQIRQASLAMWPAQPHLNTGVSQVGGQGCASHGSTRVAVTKEPSARATHTPRCSNAPHHRGTPLIPSTNRGRVPVYFGPRPR